MASGLSNKEDIAMSLSSVDEETKLLLIGANNDLAVVGIGCRFPGGSNSIEEFWSNLVGQHDCVRPVPNDRWNADYYTDSLSNELHLPAKIPSSRCGWIDFVGEFDYETFSISKREAENMDPQQKVLLEVTLQALEDSGMQYAGSKTGVYVGIGQAEQFELTTADLESINAYSVTGSALSIPSNRLSYCFDLRGPSMSIDTACSSSLTAFHLACQSIREGTCSAAVVAGVNIIMNPSTMIQFSQLGVLSPDGMCQSFSNKANGYVRSEGCGVVIIKPLKQALIDNDHIYCRIRGSAINQDGHQSPSLTMPSSQAQIEVFRMACQNSQVNPNEIFYAEAHATGTKVGDPTEGMETCCSFFHTKNYLFFF
jgi:acyl transferase domain-containing protein